MSNFTKLITIEGLRDTEDVYAFDPDVAEPGNAGVKTDLIPLFLSMIIPAWGWSKRGSAVGKAVFLTALAVILITVCVVSVAVYSGGLQYALLTFAATSNHLLIGAGVLAAAALLWLVGMVGTASTYESVLPKAIAGMIVTAMMLPMAWVGNAVYTQHDLVGKLFVATDKLDYENLPDDIIPERGAYDEDEDIQPAPVKTEEPIPAESEPAPLPVPVPAEPEPTPFEISPIRDLKESREKAKANWDDATKNELSPAAAEIFEQRLNILLLGSDAGPDRRGTRTDTIMMVSIDEATGDAIIFSLPRNLQKAQFSKGSPMSKAWPNGFRMRGDPIINAVWYWAESRRNYFPGVSDPGLYATRDAIETTLGFKADYWAMANMQGFSDLIDAIGGVTIDVKQRMAIGRSDDPSPDEWVEPGKRKLNGYEAMWYGRSRWRSDDYSRMERQRCVVGAVVKEADPLTVAQAFPALAATAKDNVRTSVPPSEISRMVDNMRRIQNGGTIRSIAFTNDVIVPKNPDFKKIKQMVSDSVKPADPAPNPKKTEPVAVEAVCDY